MNPTILYPKPLSPEITLSLTTYFPSCVYGPIASAHNLADERMESVGWGNFFIYGTQEPEELANNEGLGLPLNPITHDGVKALQATNLMYCFLVKTESEFLIFRHMATIHAPSGDKIAVVVPVSFDEVVTATQP